MLCTPCDNSGRRSGRHGRETLKRRADPTLQPPSQVVAGSQARAPAGGSCVALRLRFRRADDQGCASCAPPTSWWGKSRGPAAGSGHSASMRCSPASRRAQRREPRARPPVTPSGVRRDRVRGARRRRPQVSEVGRLTWMSLPAAPARLPRQGRSGRPRMRHRLHPSSAPAGGRPTSHETVCRRVYHRGCDAGIEIGHSMVRKARSLVGPGALEHPIQRQGQQLSGSALSRLRRRGLLAGSATRRSEWRFCIRVARGSTSTRTRSSPAYASRRRRSLAISSRASARRRRNCFGWLTGSPKTR